MTIGNVTQFSNFITGHGLNRLDGTLQQVVACIDNYAAACNCHKAEDKQKMYEICNRLYSDAVRHVIPKLKNEILAKIPERQVSFHMENGTVMLILSR